MVRPRARRRTGFTLVEVLIAMFILAVGIVGVLALHTATVVNASKIAMETYISNLGRSIDAAIAEGIRGRAFVLQETWGTQRGFLFRHDGVPTPPGPTMPALPQNLNDPGGAQLSPLATGAGFDYSIFMPSYSGAGPDPVFVFPRPGGSTDNPTGASRGVDNWITAGTAGYNGLVYLDVQRTYVLPFVAPSDNAAGALNPAIDAGGQYSFALSVRRAQAPALGAAVGTESFNTGGSPSLYPQMAPVPRQDGLYEVEIYIYRNFDKNPKSPQHVEVRRFSSLVAVGP